MFYSYWLFMILSLLTSIVYCYRAKNNLLFLTSLTQGILTIALPFMNLIYIPNQEWLPSFKNEFEFLWSQLLSGNSSAILVFIGYIVMIFLVLWNGSWITKRIQ